MITQVFCSKPTSRAQPDTESVRLEQLDIHPNGFCFDYVNPLIYRLLTKFDPPLLMEGDRVNFECLQEAINDLPTYEEHLATLATRYLESAGQRDPANHHFSREAVGLITAEALSAADPTELRRLNRCIDRIKSLEFDRTDDTRDPETARKVLRLVAAIDRAGKIIEGPEKWTRSHGMLLREPIAKLLNKGGAGTPSIGL